MKTWHILKATNLIAVLHISNENTAYWFEISRYIKYYETRTKHLLCGTKECASVHLLDSLMIGNILAKFEKNLSSGFFQGNDLNMKHTIIMLDQF